LGDDRFFVFRVAQDQVRAARTQMLLAATAGSDVVGHFNLTPILTESAPKPPPIEVSTHTINGDMTRISGFDGKVSAPHAASLELVYANGGRVAVPLTSNGSFDFRFPKARFDDFTTKPGQLIAKNKKGATVAKVWVAAPSFWIAQERNP
jgi:hypothetical protein